MSGCALLRSPQSCRWHDVPTHPTIDEAIVREKAIKKRNRAWKLALIERDNPDWTDLFDHILG
jgi:predicted GIY-YIG superfamily endonuclease